MSFKVSRRVATALLFFLSYGVPAFSRDEPRNATLVRPERGVIVAVADYSFYNYRDYSHARLEAEAHQVKKTLDLSGMPEKEFSAVRAARVSVFMYAEDGQGDGLDGEFQLVVNGHEMTVPTRGLVSTGWGWFDTRQAINWFDFDIPKEHLVRGRNEIIVCPSSGSEENDDHLIVGIDMFEDQGCSARSTDEGAVWKARPLNRDGFAGEYMIRLVLFTDTADRSKLTFSHEDFPRLPRIDMCPKIRPLSPPPRASPRLNEGDSADTFVNGAMSVAIRHDKGIRLSRLHHRAMNASAIREPMKENLFVIEVDGKRLSGSDFVVDRKQILLADTETVSVVYDISCDAAKLTGRFRVTMDRSAELQLGLSLQNRSQQNQTVKAAFPVLGGIGWSDGFRNDHYLFPFATGIVLDHPARMRSGYGGGRTYFQTMASYCPEKGGGLFLRANDQSGEYKILHMLKTDIRESDPTFQIDPLLTDARNGRAPLELVLWEPLNDDVPGTSMAFSYFGRDMEPDEQWRFASATLGVMNGDWHEAMRSYRRWFESFSHKNKYPNKLTDAFNYDSTGPEWGYRGPGDKQAYNTDPTKWGHRRMGHVADDFMTKIVDGLEHSGYWEHEEITDEMLAEHKATAAKYRVPFKLWPDRHGMLEGKNVLWGNQGDYGLTGYNERWGGLPAFREYITALKKKGYRPTLYINKAEAAFGSVMGRKHGPRWATMYPEGSYFWPYSDWQMCMDHQPWRVYLAQTCARLIEETGVDGVRIDEMGGAARICSNPHHKHTFARRRHYNELQAQSDAARQVRQAMDAVNPDSVLLTESVGFDVLGQYLDGSLLYDLTEAPFTSHVAANWEGFVGINIYRFYFPRHKVFDYQISEKHPAWRLFNATGAFNREWCYREHERQMLKDHADAFGSLNPEPMIRSRLPLVYVNRFPADGKTVYTIYNSSSEPVHGNLMAVPTVVDHHVIDLYRYAEVKTTTESDETIVSVELEPRTITCLAVLPKLFDLTRQGTKIVVQTREEMDGETVRVTDLSGATIAAGQITGRGCELALPVDTGRVICKLYRDGYVVDAYGTGRH